MAGGLTPSVAVRTFRARGTAAGVGLWRLAVLAPAPAQLPAPPAHCGPPIRSTVSHNGCSAERWIRMSRSRRNHGAPRGNSSANSTCEPQLFRSATSLSRKGGTGQRFEAFLCSNPHFCEENESRLSNRRPLRSREKFCLVTKYGTSNYGFRTIVDASAGHAGVWSIDRKNEGPDTHGSRNQHRRPQVLGGLRTRRSRLESRGARGHRCTGGNPSPGHRIDW